MALKTDFLPSSEIIRKELSNCSECNCRTKYLQIYKFGDHMKIRCPRCNYYAVEDDMYSLIDKWNTVKNEIKIQ